MSAGAFASSRSSCPRFLISSNRCSPSWRKDWSLVIRVMYLRPQRYEDLAHRAIPPRSVVIRHINIPSLPRFYPSSRAETQRGGNQLSTGHRLVTLLTNSCSNPKSQSMENPSTHLQGLILTSPLYSLYSSIKISSTRIRIRNR